MSAAATNVTLASPDPETIFSLQPAVGAGQRVQREFLDADKTRTILGPILRGELGPKIEKLVLGGKSLDSASAGVVVEALKATPSLTDADFADCIAGRDTAEALNTLQVLSDGIEASGAKLHTLNLSDNALGVRGIPRIANAFAKQSKLKHLYFNNDGLEADAVAGLTELIMKNYGGMSGQTDLHTFEIGHNCMEDAGFHALIPLIDRSPQLKQLRIATTRVRNNEGAGLAMAKALLGLKHLTSLAINDNNLGLEAGPVLAQVIENNAEHFKTLNLGDIGVGEDEENTTIDQVLKSLTKIKKNVLHHLDLSANSLTASKKFMSPLVKTIKNQEHSLVHLKIEDNELRSRGVTKLLKALEGCKHLTYLNFSNNHLGPRVVPQLVKFLQSHPHLTEIHINGNHFTDEQLDEIKAAVTENEHALQTMSENEYETEEDEEESSEEEEEVEESAVIETQPNPELDALTTSLEAVSLKK